MAASCTLIFMIKSFQQSNIVIKSEKKIFSDTRVTHINGISPNGEFRTAASIVGRK
jgi:hypothetical protein